MTEKYNISLTSRYPIRYHFCEPDVKLDQQQQQQQMPNWIYLRNMCVYPILLCGCDIKKNDRLQIPWTLVENSNLIKYIVCNVRNVTPTCMVDCRFPLRHSVECYHFGINLCLDMNAGSGNIIISLNVALILRLYSYTDFKLPWLKCVPLHSLLRQAGTFLHLV